jgi:hypothetical protein
MAPNLAPSAVERTVRARPADRLLPFPTSQRRRVGVASPEQSLIAIGKEVGARVEVGKGLMSAAATSHQIVNVGDITKDDRYVPRIAETLSELDVPLIAGDELLGCSTLKVLALTPLE